MRALGIIQARLGSTRLPNKVLADLAGRPIIEHVYLRVREAVPAVVAVTLADEALLDACLARKIPTFPVPGDPNNVLARFRAIAKAYQPHIVVRITADCPFVQPAHIRACVELAEAEGFAALGPQSGFPDGLDVEAFRVAYLDRFPDQEHVTRGVPPTVAVWHHPDLFRVRVTLDTPADLALLRDIAQHVDCNPPHHPTLEELLQWHVRRTTRKPSVNGGCPSPSGLGTPPAPPDAGSRTITASAGSTSWPPSAPSSSDIVIQQLRKLSLDS